MQDRFLTTTTPSIDEYGLYYDIEALCFNAKLVQSLVTRQNHDLRIVLKGGCCCDNLIRALTGAEFFNFASGTKPPGNLFDKLVLSFATLYPGSGRHWSNFHNLERVTEVDAFQLEQVLKTHEAMPALIAVTTSESREGISPDRLLGALMRMRGRYGQKLKLNGFQLNFGCVQETAPDVEQLNSLLDMVSSTDHLALLNENPILSLGGSVLLPILADINIPSGFRAEIRVGEAIIAGSIPGEATRRDLRETAVYRAPIAQRLSSAEHDWNRLLIEVGSTILGERDSKPTDGVLFESMSSDVSVVSVDKSSGLTDIGFIDIPLSYGEIERALDRSRGDFKVTNLRALAA